MGMDITDIAAKAAPPLEDKVEWTEEDPARPPLEDTIEWTEEDPAAASKGDGVKEHAQPQSKGQQRQGKPKGGKAKQWVQKRP
eukprot:6454981-Amphidinium_carterae.1